MSTSGIVFDIQRFSIHDGPGIRTTVFLKGCPLTCPWCHNPESQRRDPQLLFYASKCIGCKKCFEVCPVSGALIPESKERINRDICNNCGKCTETCYAQALEMCGKEMTVEQVIAEVEKDRPFYETSDGGMTISGGEPLAQPVFTVELLKTAKEAGLHTALDTSGYGGPDALRRAAAFTDLVLFDVKIADPERHRQAAGVDNRQILANLRTLEELGVAVVFRVPVIPGYTDSEENIRAAASLAAQMKNVRELDLMRYHRLGESKWKRLGLTYRLEGTEPPSEERMHQLKGLAEAQGVAVKVHG
jgi:pyruvate formate lyase activating enzyme